MTDGAYAVGESTASDLPVIWTQRAQRELEAIRAYIGAINPLAAQRLALRIVAAADSLATLSGRGRPGAQMRELLIVRPYVIRYRIRPNVVTIQGVRHGARRPLRS